MRKVISLIMILWLCVPDIVLANGGPVEYRSMPSFNFIPVSSNSISVLKEELVYDVPEQQKEDYESLTANVMVKYTMKNESDKTEKVTVAFPCNGSYGTSAQMKTLFDGKRIEHKVMSAGGIQYQGYQEGFRVVGYKEPTFDQIVSKITGQINGKPASTNSGSIQVMLFELTFSPKSVHTLEVSYTDHATMLRKMKFLYSYTPWKPLFHYYLEPAKYWKSFKDLTVTLRLPKEYSISSCSLKGINKVEDGAYQGHFDALPSENLEFGLQKAEDKEFSMVLSSLVILGIAAVLFLMRRKIGKLFTR
jgi:hypothetical protein